MFNENSAKKGYQNPFRFYFKNGSRCRVIQIKTDKMLYTKKREYEEKSMQLKPILLVSYFGLKSYHPKKYLFTFTLNIYINCLFYRNGWEAFLLLLQKIRLQHPGYFATMLHLFSKFSSKNKRRENRLLTLFSSSILEQAKEKISLIILWSRD